MGTIKTTNIEPIADNGTVTLGSSGDTFTVPSGVTVNMSSATQTGVGGVNTPTFRARLTSDQSISDNTHTKVQFNTEDYDTDNAYDNSSNYRFTVPSGKAGKYFFTTSVYLLAGGENNLSYSTLSLRKNGTTVQETNSDFRGYRIYNYTNFMTGVLDLAAGDYVEVFAYTAGTSTIVIESNNGGAGTLNIFNGYKIIE